jgi:DNA-binding transcriptional MerR regulator
LHSPLSPRKIPEVRISELSARTGVPVATVKYYLREGLLPSGERTEVNQARYGPEHVERLRLIRALVEVGGVSIAGVKDVLAALATPPSTTHDLLGTVQDAITPRTQRTATEDWTRARADVAELVTALGWRVRPDAPALDQLADILLAYRSVTATAAPAVECFGHHARLAAELAAVEVPPIAGSEPSELARSIIVGTVLGGRAFDALRRLAHEDMSAEVFGGASHRATTSAHPDVHTATGSK